MAHNHDHPDHSLQNLKFVVLDQAQLHGPVPSQQRQYACRGHLADRQTVLSPKDAWSNGQRHLPEKLRLRWEPLLVKLNDELGGSKNLEAKGNHVDQDGNGHDHTHHPHANDHAHAHHAPAGHSGHEHSHRGHSHGHGHIESQSTPRTLILQLYPKAIEKAESMRRILFEKSASNQAQIASDQVYLERIFVAVWASLTVHTHEILKASKPKKTDFPRYFKILKSIAEFDEKTPIYSLYKIKRAIEGRFSFQEYIDCL